MEINVAKLNELPEGSYQLIDMRSDRDFEYGTIPGAIHILQEELKENPQIIKAKKVKEKFGGTKKKLYLCNRI